MAHLSSIIDLTSLNGVESLFRKGTKDPWGPDLAGQLADLFIYSDNFRYIIPMRKKFESVDDLTVPSILTKLISGEENLFKPAGYDFEKRGKLDTKYLGEAFQGFERWARNSKALGKLLQLHREPWMREGHIARVGARFVYDVDALRGHPLLPNLVSGLGVEEDDILHGFDVVLRYPHYGDLADRGEYYLAHPVREIPTLPTMTAENAPRPRVVLSLADDVCAMIPKMTLDDYTCFLHKARRYIRDRDIHTLKPGSLDRETIQEIAEDLRLPVRLSKIGKVVSGVAGAIVAAAVAPVIGPAAPIVGALVSFSPTLWTGTVARGPARMSWLRWAHVRDIEKQAGDA